MIEWKNLDNIEYIPNDGQRVIVAEYGKTYAGNEAGDEWEVFGIFRIDIIMFDWENPELDQYILCSQNKSIMNAEQILSKYNIYSIINQPERSKREDSNCCEIVNKLGYVLINMQDDKITLGDFAFIQELFNQFEMRCSEHCGNTVRDK